MPAMLRVEGLRKRFGSLQALDDVNLEVGPGQLVGFLGPNGSGKTTTMRAVMGLITVDGGSITWNGVPVGPVARRRFGYMPAERGVYPKMTVRDQIVYFARLAGLPREQARRNADRWMERVDIAGRADDEVINLSTGNQQRVQLAVALVHEPEVLLLDEPFSGLDPTAVETMKAVLLEEVERGAAVLFSSHQLDLVSDVSRRVIVVDQGRIVLQGDVQQLREASPVRYVSVVFASPTPWQPEQAEVIERVGRRVTVRVGSDARASDLLADAERAGPVAEFSFAPPDLSEVFLRSVGPAAAAAATAAATASDEATVVAS
jgi:ABC-2 type transport system ATP-binding protein